LPDHQSVLERFLLEMRKTGCECFSKLKKPLKRAIFNKIRAVFIEKVILKIAV
jgi:hypothetical protein